MKTLALAAILCLSPLCFAQVEVSTGEPTTFAGDDVPDWARSLAIDPESPEAKAYAAGRKKRIETEQELKKIRMMHFRNVRAQAKRQEGIIKLHDYNDPALDPSLIEIFSREQPDVRTAILDMFADRQSEEGDTSLAWVAVFDDSAEIRAEATARLRKRMADDGSLADSSRLVIYEGLRGRDKQSKAAAAELANLLGVVEAIPWMIATQIGGNPVGGGGGTGTGRKGDLAWIAVGTQQAFVSDLTPVVGPSAVAFDPQLSVVTSGTLLRVTDAVVVEYHYEIHNSLVGLSSRLSGTDTSPLGWNGSDWREWYTKTFLPEWTRKQEEAAKTETAVGEETPKPAGGPG